MLDASRCWTSTTNSQDAQNILNQPSPSLSKWSLIPWLRIIFISSRESCFKFLFSHIPQSISNLLSTLPIPSLANTSSTYATIPITSPHYTPILFLQHHNHPRSLILEPIYWTSLQSTKIGSPMTQLSRSHRSRIYNEFKKNSELWSNILFCQLLLLRSTNLNKYWLR